jgi:hypothetical protein
MRAGRAGLLAAALALATPSAHADIPLPAAFGYIAQTWLALLTFGLSLAAVVFVEAVILRFMLSLTWARAAMASLLANVVTTLYGFVFWMGSGAMFLLALLIAAVTVLSVDRLQGAAARFKPFVKVLGYAPIPAFFVMLPVMAIDLDAGTRLLFVSLVPAFALTTLIEFKFHRAFLGDGPVLRATVTGNLATYAMIALAFAALGVRGRDNPLLSADYYVVMRIPRHIEERDVPEVLRLARLAQDIRLKGIGAWRTAHPGRDYVDYYPYVAYTVGRRLASSGHHAAALEVLGWAGEGGIAVSSSTSSEITQLIAQQRRLLAEEGAGSGGVDSR